MQRSKRYCLFIKVYLEEKINDAFLNKITHLIDSIQTDFSDFFFIRYADPTYHLRLRFFGSPKSVLGHPRQRLLSELEKIASEFGESKVTTDRYVPEWIRYGGKTGVRFAENLFKISSIHILNYLNLESQEPALNRALFALSSNELLLHGLGIGPENRDNFYYRTTSLQIERNIDRSVMDTWISQFGSAINQLRNNPLDFWKESHLALAKQQQEYYKQVKGAVNSFRSEFSKFQRPIPVLANSYVHMHFNRLGLGPYKEHFLRALRKSAAPSKLQERA